MKKKTLAILLLVCCLGAALLAYAATGDLFVNGKLGVGTTSPTHKLHVSDTAQVTQVGLQSTHPSGIPRLWFQNGSGAVAGYAWNVGLRGDGSNRFAFEADTTGAGNWVQHLVIQPNGNVGIGTPAPITKLHVVVPNATTNTGGVGTSYSTVFTNAVDTTLALRSMGSGVFHLATDSIGRELRLGGGLFEEAVTIKSGGNVGIGTTSPASDAAWASPGLDISGTRGAAILRTTGATGIATLRMTGPGASYVDDWHINMYAGANSYLAFYPKAGGGNTGLVLKNDGNVGIGTITPAYKLDVAGTINAKEVLVNGAPLAGGSSQWGNLTAPAAGVYYNTGNVGIGTTGPGAKLDVAGRIWQTGTGQSVFIGEGAGTNDDLSNNLNTFIGYQAGYSNTTGFSNVANGYQALYSNTTNAYNTAIGYQALYSSTGGANQAIGWYALRANTTGYNNVAIGHAVADANTTGFSNIAIGATALRSNTTGSNNIAIGEDAGHYQADGLTGLTTAGNSVYIGINSRGFNNSDSNSIVIGDSAIGIGANSVVLGNNNIVTTALKGNVGIGTATPAYKLDVAGTINAQQVLVNGAPLAGGSSQWGNLTAPAAGVYYTTGNVGIGTTSPADQLEITGNLRLPTTSSSAGSINVGSNRYIHFYNNSNVFIGQGSGNFATTGLYNYAMGSFTLDGLTSGYSNIAIGYNTLSSVSSGLSNVAIGHGSLQQLTTGSQNTVIGATAGDLAGNGSGNVFIGFGAGGNETGSNKLYIANSNTASPLIYGDFSSNVLAINGNVGIGTITPEKKLDVSGDIRIVSGTGEMFVGQVKDAADNTIRLSFADVNSDTTSDTRIRPGSNGDIVLETLVGHAGKIIFKPQTVEAMRIDASGNVGIGTTSPTGILHVQPGAASAGANGKGINLYAQGGGTGDTNGGDVVILAGANSGSGSRGTIIFGRDPTYPHGIQIGRNGNFYSLSLNGDTSMYIHTPDANRSLILQNVRGAGNGQGLETGVQISPNYIDLNTAGDGYTALLVNVGDAQAGATGSKFIQDWQVDGASKMVITNTGNVGIGTANPQARLDVNGSIYQRGAQLHADYVFEPAYKLESVEEHARFMWQEKHLKAVDSQRKDENGQEIIEIGGRTRGILEELEKAHIYIEQLHNQNKELTRRVETLEKSLSMKKEK